MAVFWPWVPLAAAFGWAFWRGVRSAAEVRVRHVVLPSDRPGLRGRAVLHLSDLHFPTVSWPSLRRTLQSLAGRSWDLVALTGDYTESEEGFGPFAEFLEILAGMRAKAKAAVLGNHELFAYPFVSVLVPYIERWGPVKARPRDPARTVAMLEAAGFAVLRPGRESCLEGEVFVAGLEAGDDGMPESAFCPEPPRAAGLAALLAHSPDALMAVPPERLGRYDLALCGHTHGGQVCLPGGVPVLTRTRKAWRAGLVRGCRRGPGGVRVNISNGAGQRLGFRSFCPAEVVVIVFGDGAG